jgi:protein-L-isoaspartate(D-aspartate) O-methyltransferase
MVGPLSAALLVLVAGAQCSRGLDREIDYTALREAMVEHQLAAPGRDITDKRVLQVMRDVPRHEFVPAAFRAAAYMDCPVPIGSGQTISQPFIVAFMTEKLEPKPTDRVLEIGTGSGYQAAILSRLVKEVYTIEIVAPLAEQAAATLKRVQCDNVHVKAGDGYRGWPEFAPFDAIIVTCAPDEIPAPLIEQLAEGGRMIIPVGTIGTGQDLYLLEKKGKNVTQRAVLPVRFVPMTREQR